MNSCCGISRVGDRRDVEACYHVEDPEMRKSGLVREDRWVSCRKGRTGGLPCPDMSNRDALQYHKGGSEGWQ